MTGFLFLLGVAVVMTSRGCLAQNEDDAWKALQAMESGYLAYTTKADVPFRCFSLIRQSLDTSNKTATFDASFQVGDDTTRIKRTNLAVVGQSPDTIHLHVDIHGTPRELTVKALYSDYRTCYISTNSHIGKPVCFMWVFFNTTEQDVESCLNRLKSKCGPDVTKVYDDERCGHPKRE